MQNYVYILTNYDNSVFYIGVTSDLIKRVYEHKNKIFKGFTSKYNVNKLVYYEITTDITIAISREKQMKNLSRQNKIKLIVKNNPNFEDLSLSF